MYYATPPLNRLFRPRSVAIVGASTRASSIASRLLRELRRAPWQPELSLVNPNLTELDGSPVHASLTAIGEPPDVAIIAVRSDLAIGAVREAVEVGVPFVMVVSSGFEGSDADDHRRALEAALSGGTTRLVGPNSEGLIDLDVGAALTFNPAVEHRTWSSDRLAGGDDGERGGVAVVSQSGALGFAAMQLLEDSGLRVRAVVSTGNEFDLDVADYIGHFAEHSGCAAVVAVLESFHPVDRFLAAADVAHRHGCGLVVARLGLTEAGMSAVASHTGRAASDREVSQAIAQAAGAFQVTVFEDLVPATMAMVSPLRGRAGQTVVVTPAGGPGVVMSDELCTAGAQIETLSSELRSSLGAILPEYASTRNPVDVTAEVGFGEPMRQVAQRLADAPEVAGAVLVGSFQYRSLAGPDWVETLRKWSKPLTMWCYSGPSAENRAVFNELGIPWSRSARAAAVAMAALQHRTHLRQLTPDDGVTSTGGVAAPTSFAAAEAALVAAGLEAAPRIDLGSGPELADAPKGRNGPVVLKLITADFRSRTELGGVITGVTSAAQRRRAHRELRGRAIAHDLQSWSISAQSEVRGHELFVAALNRPDVGLLFGLGSGGVLTNVIADAKFALLPVSRDGLHEWVLEQPIIRRCLEGYRDNPPVHESTLTDFCDRFVSWVSGLDRQGWGVVELNPVIVQPNAAVIVDIKILPPTS